MPAAIFNYAHLSSPSFVSVSGHYQCRRPIIMKNGVTYQLKVTVIGAPQVGKSGEFYFSPPVTQYPSVV